MILNVLSLAACLASSPMTACAAPSTIAAPLDQVLGQVGAEVVAVSSPEWGRAAAGQTRPLIVPRLRGNLRGSLAGKSPGELSLAFAPQSPSAAVTAPAAPPLHLDAVVSLSAPEADGLDALLLHQFGPPTLRRHDAKAGTTLLWCQFCGGMAIEEAVKRCRASAGFPLLEDVSALCGRTIGAVWRLEPDGSVRLELWADEHGPAGEALRAVTAPPQ